MDDLKVELATIKEHMKHLDEKVTIHIEDDKRIHSELMKEIKGLSTRIAVITGGIVVLAKIIDFLK